MKMRDLVSFSDEKTLCDFYELSEKVLSLFENRFYNNGDFEKVIDYVTSVASEGERQCHFYSYNIFHYSDSYSYEKERIDLGSYRFSKKSFYNKILRRYKNLLFVDYKGDIYFSYDVFVVYKAKEIFHKNHGCFVRVKSSILCPSHYGAYIWWTKMAMLKYYFL